MEIQTCTAIHAKIGYSCVSGLSLDYKYYEDEAVCMMHDVKVRIDDVDVMFMSMS